MATCTKLSRFLQARRRLRRFSRDTTGAVAVMAALAFPVLVGGMALGAEASFWYLSQRKMQQAADFAAHAAALELRSGRSKAEIEAAATHIAEANNFGGDDDTLTVRTPPTTGSRAGNPRAVEVIAERQQTRYFTLIYSTDDVVISARAVTEVQGGENACLLTLAPTGRAISVEGSSDVVFEGCDVATNSNASDAFYMQGGKVEFTAGCVHSVGGVSATSGLNMTTCKTANTQSPVTRDPYADLAEPLNVGTCAPSNRLDGGKSGILVETKEMHPLGIEMRRYCDGLDIKGKVTFESGLYIIDGGTLRINGGADVSGEGVTFFLTNGATIDFLGTAAFELSAPSVGALSGVLLYGDPGDVDPSGGVEHKILGNAASFLNGAIYLPSRALTYTGSYSGAGGCTQIVTRSVTFTGSSAVSVSCSAAGTRPILTGGTNALVE